MAGYEGSITNTKDNKKRKMRKKKIVKENKVQKNHRDANERIID